MGALAKGLVALFVLAVLGWFCIYNKAPKIEAEIARSTSTAVVAAGGGTRFAVSGRDVTLRGTLPGQADIEELVASVSSKDGVRRVVNELTVEPAAVAAIEVATPETSVAEEFPAVTDKPVEDASTASMPADMEAARNCQALFDEALASEKILFGSGSATIRQRSSALLRRLAEIARECPEARIEVAGHTDSSGADAFNQRLSEQRAQSVLDYLRRSGVDASRLRAVGYGESQPIDDNATAEGQENNRRIEFRVDVP